MSRKQLTEARINKDDEFYTILETIEAEIDQNAEMFRGKRVYCNCDDPSTSQFFQYFFKNFKSFGLSGLVATCFKKGSNGLMCEVTYDENTDQLNTAHRLLNGDGDFRSQECLSLLGDCDVVVTNPRSVCLENLWESCLKIISIF